MKVAVISIGRKIGAHDMYHEDWSAFKAVVRKSVLTHGTLLGNAEGHGYWTDDNGDTFGEETYWVMVKTTKGNVKKLRANLSQIAGRFGQDAIGITVADEADTLAFAGVES
jgi:hypothetical protein